MPLLATVPDLKIWKKLAPNPELRNAEEFCVALEVAGCKCGDHARNMLRHPAFLGCLRETRWEDLMSATVTQLGFLDPVTLVEIYSRARELGWGLCSARTGPRLRLQHGKEPSQERLFVAMKPIAVPHIKPVRPQNDCLRIFVVSNGFEGKFLFGYGSNNLRLQGNDRVVFRRLR